VGLLRDGIANGDLPWRQCEVVSQTGSTNADLLARAAAGEDIDGLVLVAEHQTAGRGRNGRSWSAAPGAQLTLSVGISAADVPTGAWGLLPLAAGVAVVDAVAAVTAVRPGLKWPNDVLADDRKLSGILAEVASPKPLVVLGIGLNVTLSVAEIGEPAAGAAPTSLFDLGVTAPDRDVLLRALLTELGARVGEWRAGDARLITDYRARSTTIGARVRALLPGGSEIVGIAHSIDDQGRLCIDQTGGGEIVAVSAADVVHLR
jgi:BirA family transcriptional regulator, biotin operon repressor / biotin---[acetyl-CoA-carboxylase] ligase